MKKKNCERERERERENLFYCMRNIYIECERVTNL